MILFLLPIGLAWVGMLTWLWYAEFESQRYIARTYWKLPLLEYYDLPWAIVLFFILPLATAWVTLEFIRLWRKPRLFDKRVPGTWWRRIALGSIVGPFGVALFSLATVWHDKTHLPDVAHVILAVALSTLLFTVFLPRITPGRCIICHYDTRHLPFPKTPGPRLCPECGAQIA